jgi:hypothetical protein
MEARGHAGNGDDAACSLALREAERFFQHRNVADDPEWISYIDAAELAGESAHCFRDLGNPRLAQEFVSGAVELGDPAVRRRSGFRWRRVGAVPGDPIGDDGQGGWGCFRRGRHLADGGVGWVRRLEVTMR